jgi:hypothetical protein
MSVIIVWQTLGLAHKERALPNSVTLSKCSMSIRRQAYMKTT